MSLGFSVYFGLDNKREENIKLLKDAKAFGFKRIFTSLHIPEANYEILKSEVKEFFEIAKEYEMDIISDISPNTFKFLGLENMDLRGLSEIGVKTIRIDFGYTEDRGIKIGAFVQSNNRKRSPLKDGLPTLEDHRAMEVREACNHLFALGNDSVFIGDSLPSNEELKELSILKSNAIELDINLKSKNEVVLRLLKEVYTARIDEARDAIRAAESRLILNGDKIDPENTIEKLYGDITIDNIKYMRYMGELQIIKNNQREDERTNVVASVLQNKLYLLKYIVGGKKFYFNIIDN